MHVVGETPSTALHDEGSECGAVPRWFGNTSIVQRAATRLSTELNKCR